MARRSGGGGSLSSSQTLSLLSGATQASVSFWYWIDSYNQGDRLGMELSANFNSNQGTFIFDADAAGAVTYLGFNNAGSIRTFNFTSQPAAGKWHHVAFVMDLAQYANVAIYLDGVVQAGFAGTGTGTFGNYALYLLARNNSSLFMPGRIHEVAIWSRILLTSADAQALFMGLDPRIVRPANLAYHWPITTDGVEDNWATPQVNYLALNGTITTPPPNVPARYRRAAPRSWVVPAAPAFSTVLLKRQRRAQRKAYRAAQRKKLAVPLIPPPAGLPSIRPTRIRYYARSYPQRVGRAVVIPSQVITTAVIIVVRKPPAYWRQLYPAVRRTPIALPLGPVQPVVAHPPRHVRQYFAVTRIRFVPMPVAPASQPLPIRPAARQIRQYYPQRLPRFVPMPTAPAPFIPGPRRLVAYRTNYPRLPGRAVVVSAKGAVILIPGRMRQTRALFPVPRIRFVPAPIAGPSLIVLRARQTVYRSYYPQMRSRFVPLPICPANQPLPMRVAARPIRQYYPIARFRLIAVTNIISVPLPAPTRIRQTRALFPLRRPPLVIAAQPKGVVLINRPARQLPRSVIRIRGPMQIASTPVYVPVLIPAKIRQSRVLFPLRRPPQLIAPPPAGYVLLARPGRLFARPVPMPPRRTVVVYQTTTAVPIIVRGRQVPVRTVYPIKRLFSGNLLQNLPSGQNVVVGSFRIVR